MAMYFYAAAAAIKVIGAISDANSNAGTLKGQATAADYNARALTAQAQQIGAVGARNEEMQRRVGRAAIGQQIATGAEGSLADTGSSLAVLRQSEVMANLDALKVRYGAQSDATSLLTQAQGQTYQSALSRALAKRARLAGYLGAAGQGLSSVAGAYGMGSK